MSRAADGTESKFLFASDGVKLHCAIAGDLTGRPVMLLHGFPDAWFGWRPQIKALAEAGFHVVAPDQRGYNTSDKPPSRIDYRMDRLVEDVFALADSMGWDDFCLAGHDWGAAVAWVAAIRKPERIKRLAILNVPHPLVMRRFLMSEPKQMIRSWYIFFFFIPLLPEALGRAGRWHRFKEALPPDMTPAEVDEYVEAWSRPGAFTAMLNWYRAALQYRTSMDPERLVEVPTRIIWGKRDRYLSYEMAEPSRLMCRQGELVTLEKATHWVMRDAPQEVSDLLVEHFSASCSDSFQS